MSSPMKGLRLATLLGLSAVVIVVAVLRTP